MSHEKDSPAPAGKRPYSTPMLTVHGDLRTLTAAKGGTNTDNNGKPKTKLGVQANA